MAVKQSRAALRNIFGKEAYPAIKNLSAEEANNLADIIAKPEVEARLTHSKAPYNIALRTQYGTINLNSNLQNIDSVYINGQNFAVKDDNVTALQKLTGNEADVLDELDHPVGRQVKGRSNKAAVNSDLNVDEIRDEAYKDLEGSGITYQTIYQDLAGLTNGTNIDLTALNDEVVSSGVDEDDIAHFLIYDSQYKDDIASAVYGVAVEDRPENYNFKTQTADDSFAGQLLSRLGASEAQYDAEKGVMQIGDRKITNIPQVDHNGVFESNGKRYLPYKTAYFVGEGANRIDRMRLSDPIENSLDGLAVQYKMTKGDIKFQTPKEVTRNLPDFDNHPYGKEILDTLKRKIKVDESYSQTNSLQKYFHSDNPDEELNGLGATNTIMLDENAKGIIDPFGTSNGTNMGKIMYLTSDCKINPDGSLTPGKEEHSAVGKLLSKNFGNNDNVNRNQMSFNAFLTSVDVKKVKVAYTEFALWNAEDAVVMTKHGAENAFSMEKKAGDKVEDLHGNKSTISLIADGDRDPQESKDKHLTQADEFARLNPDVDIIVSPISLASRVNMGVPHEALEGEKEDLHLPNGKTIKDGIVEMTYMSLPQTAEHKSKDYAKDGNGRRYSTLLHYGLASKVGSDLYDKALINPEIKQDHINEVNNTFERLGVSFADKDKMIADGNIQNYTDSENEIDADSLRSKTPRAIRSELMNQMDGSGSINIDLGSNGIKSPLTGKTIRDSFEEAVLPIRIDKDGTIPYRYNKIFEKLSLGMTDDLQDAYNSVVASDYSNLTKKDNLMKNIDTMYFKQSAHTDVLTPDPTLPLDSVRANVDDKDVIIHRDPVIQSGNVISMHNVKDGNANTVQVNPLIEVMMDADNDGDTLGIVGYDNLNLDKDGKKKFFDKSSMVEQVRQYGTRVFLETDDSHFQAALRANHLNDNDLHFDDDKTNQDLVKNVEAKQRQIVDSPDSYGAYGLSFTDSQSVKDGLNKLADDGIKGDREKIDQHFEHGYSDKDNKEVLNALIAKGEWTGPAGATTNSLISGLSDEEFDPKLVRVAMDVTKTMTQSTLQLKNNADKLPVIDADIKEMKKVMNGEDDPEHPISTEDARSRLKDITDGLLEPQAIDEFVDRIAEKQTDPQHFGSGVINSTAMTTTKASYQREALGRVLNQMVHQEDVQEAANIKDPNEPKMTKDGQIDSGDDNLDKLLNSALDTMNEDSSLVQSNEISQ